MSKEETNVNQTATKLHPWQVSLKMVCRCHQASSSSLPVPHPLPHHGSCTPVRVAQPCDLPHPVRWLAQVKVTWQILGMNRWSEEGRYYLLNELSNFSSGKLRCGEEEGGMERQGQAHLTTPPFCGCPQVLIATRGWGY